MGPLFRGFVMLLRKVPPVVWCRFGHVLVVEVTREINEYVTEGKIMKARELIRKQTKERADIARKILNDPEHRKEMNEKTKRLYERFIAELEE